MAFVGDMHRALIKACELVDKWEAQAQASSLTPYAVAKQGCVADLREALEIDPHITGKEED